MEQNFDFIVIGAGSAGAPAAVRLSENGRYSVLLIEPGGPTDSFNHRLPLGVAHLIHDERYAWKFESGPEAALGGYKVFTPRGLGLGGSSAINGMIWVRGAASAYDGWRDMGLPGWGWDDVLPFFKKLESFSAGDPAIRGHEGPISVEWQTRSALGDAFNESCAQAGYRPVADYNAGNVEGWTYLQTNTRNGWRCSTYDGYLKPAMNRPNLRIETGLYADRLIFDGQRVVGVETVQRDGQSAVNRQSWRAAKEVLLCAGAYHSPALLERSGIGQPGLLHRLGIDVRMAMPAVGENMLDHMRACTGWRVRDVFTINDIVNSPIGKMRGGLDFFIRRRGWLRTASMAAQMAARSSPDVSHADIKLQINAISNDFSKGGLLHYPVEKEKGISLLTWPMYTRSKGHSHIASRMPWDQPDIVTNFLSDPYDQRLTVAGLRLTRKVAEQPALQRYIVSETFPGVDVRSDDELLAYAKATGITVYHPTTTCRMGSSSDDVVDAQLRLRGLSGLRIADASVMPSIPASNTNACSIMIGERAAHWALEAASAAV